VQDVTARYSLDLISRERLNRKGAPIRRHELDFERLTIAIHLDNGANIASNETVGWQILP
jgi:hypothetical protein